MNQLKTLALLLVAIPLNYNSFSQKKITTPRFSVEEDTKKVKLILKNIDDYTLDLDTKMSVYSDDVVHMAQGNRAITNIKDLRTFLAAEYSYGHSIMTHEIVTLQSYDDMVLIRGRVTGSYYPNSGGSPFPFETNNMMVFKRFSDGSLKVSQVIFNRIERQDDQKQTNPFIKFVGEWTLKDDNWSQNWGQGDEHIKILNHHTVNRELNTSNSLLSVIDGTPPYGHIFWSYNPVKKEVNHLSSFGTIRSGVGKGTVNDNGDVTLKVSFEGEPEGTYRIYTYKWISQDAYELKSIQYDSADKVTGNFYGGTFVRIDKSK